MGTATAILGGAAMAALISGIFGLIGRALDKKDGKHTKCDEHLTLLTEAQMVSMYDRIKYLGTCYIADKEIATDDLEALLRMHDVYHRLGGNGYLDAIMTKVCDLPIKEAAK